MKFPTLFLAASAAALAWSGASLAQPSADELLVTAARTPLEPGRVPSATTVFDAVDLERRQSRYVTDLLRAVPGFAISRSGVEGAFTEVRVRGSEANQVLVLIDGVRVNDPALGDSFRWEQLTTHNIERIEIVRGPQSALWGTDAVGAVVNIITKQASGKLAADGFIEKGSDSALSGGVGSRFSINGVRVNAAVERIKTGGESIARNGSEKDDSDTSTASLGIAYDFREDIGLDVRVRAVEAYSQFDSVDFGTGLPADSDSATDNETLAARAQLRLGSATDAISHTAAVDWYDSDNINLIGGAEDSSSRSDRLTFAWQTDFRLDSDVLSLAVEHEETDYRQRGQVGFGDPNQDQSIDVTSLVADYQGLSHDRFSWFASARYDDNSDFDDSVTGRLAATYAVSNATKVRASIGSAQKNPTFTERFGFFPDSFVGNPDLKPERSVAYELGVDQRLLNDAILLQLSWYGQNLKDEIRTVFGAISTAENAPGKSTRKGVEAAATWTVSSQLDFSAAYSYLDAEEELTPGMQTVELRRPRHTGSVQAAWRTSGGRFDTVLAADYSGTRADIFFPPFPSPSEIVRLDNYWLVDLTAQYQLNDSVTLVVRGQNLLDEDYEEVFGYNTLGRSAYIGFRASIGN
ncbi:MAG: TonB-dependent receptor [Gammaproteobacteria bacterium]|nr:TonB-dependent receptor [Gammaproteobacteria bacterium]